LGDVHLDGSAEEDARADIYSLACVLYEALTGHPPFAGDTMTQLMWAHAYNPPPRPSTTQPDVPAAVDEVIATGMAKDRDQRYTTTIELAHAAQNAITAPIKQPTPPPATLPRTAAGNQSGTQPRTLMAGSLSPAKPAPPQPPLATQTRAGGISRRTTIALIAGALRSSP
jgi:serine/threonine protein kinase, bacterial